MVRVVFVCVGNAGRSQLAGALAEQEAAARGLDVEVVTGGTDPKDHVHEDVVRVLGEEGIDIGGRVPREITPGDLEEAVVAVTMGCSIEEFAPSGWDGEREAWAIPHPEGDDLDAVRAQRDEIRARVTGLFDRLEKEHSL